jgi:hypothetical protein
MEEETEVLIAQTSNMITNQSGLMIDSSDIDIPRVNVVQKTSDIDAPTGSLVLAKLYVAKDSYRQTFKRLATFAAFNRSTPIQNRVWNFQTHLMEKGKYSWYVPSLAATSNDTPAAVVEFLTSFNA